MRHCFRINQTKRNTMKKLILAATLSCVFVASGAVAEDDRDQAYGKHDMGASPDSSMSRPSTADEGRFVNRAPGTTIGRGTEREINRGERRDRMLRESAVPDATEDAPAGR
jgi:hypothetical protein